MSRDPKSQTREDQGADGGLSRPSETMHPEAASGNKQVGRPGSHAELFPGLNRATIRGVIHRVTKNINTVDEIEQEVSVIWHNNRWRWRFIRCPQEYVHKIARREAVKHERLESSRRERFKAYVGSEQPLDAPLLRQEAPDTAKIIAARSTLEAFKASLPDYLVPVLDRRLQGCETQEIAVSLGIAFNTVKSYLAEIASYAENFFDQGDIAPSPQNPRKER
jgi:DNA-directed RNA polymerase specialized sigma24 family protein